MCIGEPGIVSAFPGDDRNCHRSAPMICAVDPAGLLGLMVDPILPCHCTTRTLSGRSCVSLLAPTDRSVVVAGSATAHDLRRRNV